MQYSFTVRGHRNILATHKNTLEFTKDDDLTNNGDCIVGIKADYDLEQIKPFLGVKLLKIIILIGGQQDSFTAVPNPNFSSNLEMVFRITDYESSRTLGLRASKAAKDLNPTIIESLKNGAVAIVTIESVTT